MRLLVHYQQIFNLFLTTSIFPDQLNIAKVIRFYIKKDDNEIFSNHRPVSVLPCFSKILENCFSTDVLNLSCLSIITNF